MEPVEPQYSTRAPVNKTNDSDTKVYSFTYDDTSHEAALDETRENFQDCTLNTESHRGIRLATYRNLRFKENSPNEIANFCPPAECIICSYRFPLSESAVDMAVHYYEQHKDLVPFECPFPKVRKACTLTYLCFWDQINSLIFVEIH